MAGRAIWTWLAALIVAAGSCLAQPHAEKPVAHEDASVTVHEGSQEVNIFDPRYDLGLWTLVVFLALFFILKKYAFPLMVEGLEKREERILGALREAQLAREEAQKIRAQLQQEMNTAHEKVRDLIEEARRDGERLMQELQAKARSEIQVERDRLHREIDTARDQALQEIWTRTSQLVTLISTKLIGRELTTGDHHRLIDESIQELGQANVGWVKRNVS